MTYAEAIVEMKLNNSHVCREADPEYILIGVPDEQWTPDEPLFLIAWINNAIEVVEVPPEYRSADDWIVCGRLGRK